MGRARIVHPAELTTDELTRKITKDWKINFAPIPSAIFDYDFLGFGEGKDEVNAWANSGGSLILQKEKQIIPNAEVKISCKVEGVKRCNGTYGVRMPKEVSHKFKLNSGTSIQYKVIEDGEKKKLEIKKVK